MNSVTSCEYIYVCIVECMCSISSILFIPTNRGHALYNGSSWCLSFLRSPLREAQ